MTQSAVCTNEICLLVAVASVEIPRGWMFGGQKCYENWKI